MPDPVGLTRVTISLEGPAAAPTTRPEQRFSDVLAAQAEERETPVLDAIAQAARSLAASDRAVQRGLRRARRGEGMDPARLLALQSGVYRYTQEVELASKLVDKASSAVKTILQSQQ